MGVRRRPICSQPRLFGAELPRNCPQSETSRDSLRAPLAAASRAPPSPPPTARLLRRLSRGWRTLLFVFAIAGAFCRSGLAPRRAPPGRRSCALAHAGAQQGLLVLFCGGLPILELASARARAHFLVLFPRHNALRKLGPCGELNRRMIRLQDRPASGASVALQSHAIPYVKGKEGGCRNHGHAAQG